MVLLGLRVGVPVEVIQREAPVMLSMVHSSPWCNSMVELNPRWNSIYGGLLLCGLWANRARVFLGVLFLGAWWALGAVVPLLCSHPPKFCVQEWRRTETHPGHPKPCGWSVEFSAEMGITHGAEPLPGVAGDLGASFSWWHQEATTCQGWAFPAIPCRPRRQTAGDSPAHPGSPGPPPEPITPPCSSSSLLLFKAVVEEGENPALQLLPGAAGMWEGEGAEPPAQQLKITKYFPNIIRFPCKQLP